MLPVPSRTKDNSLSAKWVCQCGLSVRTPNRTQAEITRNCKCGRVFVFGPKSGDGAYKATTVPKSWGWQ